MHSSKFVGRKAFFDRNTTNLIKGIALIFMFVHHFFTFPNWWGRGISYPSIARIAPYFHLPFKICVPIFCFLTGYFYFFAKEKTLRYSVRKITDLLLSYWFVFLPTAVFAIGYVGYSYSVGDFLKEMFGLYCPTMSFCWYVSFYLFFMLLFPLLAKLLLKNPAVDIALSFFVIPLLFRILKYAAPTLATENLFSYMEVWFPTVLAGYLFAAYDWFSNGFDALLEKFVRNDTIKVLLCMVAGLAAMMSRWGEPELSFVFKEIPVVHVSLDVIGVPVFIYGIAKMRSLISVKWLERVVGQIGKYSMLMWFTSCLFFGNCKEVLQPILYLPKNPVLVLVWGLLLCFVFSFVIDIVAKKAQEIKNRLLFGM